MSWLKKCWLRSSRWPHFFLLVIVMASLALHFATIMSPAEVAFDEYHYVTDARSIIKGEGTQRPEHPPLAKLFIVAGMKIFGDNPFGWRIFSVIFGTAAIVIFYYLCRSLNIGRRATNLATYVFGFENMNFLHAAVAMLDVYMVTFMLLSFLMFVRRAYVLSALGMGLSVLCKLTGAMAAPGVGLHWLVSVRRQMWYFLAFVILAPAFFFVLLPSFDWLANGRLIDPIQHIKDMVSLSGSLTFESAAHVAATRPWLWVALPLVMFYWYEPHYIGAISFTVWAVIVPVVAYMFYRAIRWRDSAGSFVVCWFASTYLLWIPLSIVTNRISFVYYFYPTIGAICIGIGVALSKLMDKKWAMPPSKRRRALAIGIWGYLVLHMATFVILAPDFSRWINLIRVQA